MTNHHRSFSINGLGLAKIALAVCSTIALSTVANAESVPANGDIGLTAATYTVAESSGSVTLTATRSGGTQGAVSVTYTTVNASALAGQAYTASSGTLTWANGDGSSKTFTIPISNTSSTGTQAFYVRLKPVGSTLMGTHTSATVDIVSSSSPVAPSNTKSIQQWVSCSESVDETAQVRAALAAAANNAFTLVIDCPVRIHTGAAGGEAIAIPNGVTLSFQGAGEFLAGGTAFTIEDLSQVTLIDWNLVEI